jgi:hypothetical protein
MLVIEFSTAMLMIGAGFIVGLVSGMGLFIRGSKFIDRLFK